MKLLIAAFLLMAVTFSFAEENSKRKMEKSESVEEILEVSRALKAHEKPKKVGDENSQIFSKLGFEANHQKRVNSKVKIKYLNDVFAKATPEDFKDQEKLLEQLTFSPSHKDSTTGVQIFKVTNVVKGSLFEREGLKVGDLIANGSSPEKAISN